jgi:hypothetical protein
MKIVAITPNKKQDYLTETVIEGFKHLNAKIIASDVGNGIEKSYDDQTLIDESKDADYIIAFWGKVRDNNPPKHYLLDRINRWNRTAYVDGSEWSQTGYPEPNQLFNSQILKIDSFRKGKNWINQHFLQKAAWYFKRECYKEDAQLGIYPLLFGFVDRMKVLQNENKDIDVFCGFGQDKDGLRKEAIAICDSFSLDYNINISKNLSYSDYKQTLSKSLISIDAWGGGDCCARLWEIMGNGVCCLYQKYSVCFPNMPEEKQALSFSTKEELKQKLEYLLSNKHEAKKIGEEGKKLVEKFHTSEARVISMLEIMEKK